MSDMPELKPCSFCGKSVTLRNAIPRYDDAFVYCDECSTEGKRCDTNKEAVTFWNRRHDAPELVALVEALRWFEGRRKDAIARAKTISAPEDAAVKALCDRYGYGAVMDSAARQWAKLPAGSAAFFVGGCIGDKSAETALAAYEALK